MASPPLLLCTGSTNVSDDVRRTLDEAGFDLRLQSLAADTPLVDMPTSLVLIDGSVQPDDALKVCQRFRTGIGEQCIPILFLVDASANGIRQASLECGADTILRRPFEPGELLAQIQALLRIKERHDSLHVKAAEVHRVNKRLQAAYQQIDLELELARRIQESFLPQSLPNLPNVRFAVQYKPCNHVGGDFYDVFRLDEQHTGFYVADAMGHGVPASLLTIFVKKGVKAKEINGQSYRLIPPDEVLGKLNNDLIDQALSEHPFITMVYVLYNHRDGVLQFSRAGHPYPLYIPREGPVQLWQIEGSLLGVFDTQFRVQTQRLQSGDKLILYTDGMDAAAFAQQPVGLASLLAAAQEYRGQDIDSLVERLSRELFGQTRRNDDLTVLGMQVM